DPTLQRRSSFGTAYTRESKPRGWDEARRYIYFLEGPCCNAKQCSVGGFTGTGGFRGAGARDFSVGFGAAIAENLPGVADLLNFIEIQVCNEEFVLIAASLCNNFPARTSKVALAVEFANLPGMLGADAVDGSDKICVGD